MKLANLKCDPVVVFRFFNVVDVIASCCLRTPNVQRVSAFIAVSVCVLCCTLRRRCDLLCLRSDEMLIRTYDYIHQG